MTSSSKVERFHNALDYALEMLGKCELSQKESKGYGVQFEV